MSGKPHRQSAYIASRSLKQRKQLCRDYYDQLREKFVEAGAQGKVYSVDSLADGLKSYARQFSENVMIHFDTNFAIRFKHQFEFDCNKCKYAFKWLKARRISEVEALRIVGDRILPSTDILCRLPEYGLQEIALEKIVRSRSYSNLAIDTLADYSGREPETVRKLLRSDKESKLMELLVTILFTIVVAFLNKDQAKNLSRRKMKEVLLEDSVKGLIPEFQI